MLAFVVYYNLINMAQAWIATGRISQMTSLLLLHGVTLILTLLWLAYRHNNWNPRDLFSRVKQAPAGSTP